MHLLRVQVPDFRGLKNIDITFEKDFFPKIFPLGSQNGGGKSTLLQLIFVLLHCSFDDDKKQFLQNLLHGFKIYDGEDKRFLAIIDIWDGEKIVNLQFISYTDYCLKQLLSLNLKKETVDESEEFFSDFKKLEIVKNEFDYLRTDPDRHDEIVEVCESLKQLEVMRDKNIEYLHSKNIIYVCNYSNERKLNNEGDESLLCHFSNIDRKKTQEFLKKLSYKIFLAAPSTQVLLFLPLNGRQLLFRNPNNLAHTSYMVLAESARFKLNGLFTYDFIAVELFIELFKDARDRDFREAIKTGSYGNNYQTLINDLNLLLGNKKINLDEDFSGVNFKLDNNGETIELYPEDLSHGELKRLSIYIWLKSRNIEDAIVLMDEVEIAFHPDWQYQIISDLKEWAPSNQYILATHSYALCEALTPAHVKEIEPKLIKPESNITNES
ncbi:MULTISPECIES: AAA family ATPase [unclassified Microcoleus]|uniref:AAA family ATPase n=1 Tax=unclassified Microcoleus TaxID=2642155 RepID=UPI0025E17536|nr:MULTISPECIES: AAA family ATPase [unclassified Microcoleus]